MDKRTFVEEPNPNGFIMRYQIRDVLFSGRSEFQKVEVVETTGFGRMLLNDDLVMITEKDEFMYHDMISHVPLFVHPNPKRVLIIGGGDGGTAREVLRHKEVEHVDMVEIDGLVVEACRNHIRQTACGMDDNPRFNLHIDDGVKYVRENKTPYDVIIVDSTDPIGPAQPLFGSDFYRDVYNSLTDNGIVVAQGESPFYHNDTQNALMRILAETFPVATFYNFNNLTYPGGFWSFAYASKGLRPIKDFDPSRVRESGLSFQYYNEQIHCGAFALPQFQLDALGEYRTTDL